jgi:hypothetical protein
MNPHDIRNIRVVFDDQKVSAWLRRATCIVHGPFVEALAHFILMIRFDVMLAAVVAGIRAASACGVYPWVAARACLYFAPGHCSSSRHTSVILP